MSVSDFKNNYKKLGRYYIEQYNRNAFHLIYCKNFTGLSHKDKTKILPYFFENEIDKVKRAFHSQECSLSRSKRNIKRICLSNDFDYFATWTVNAKFCNRFYIEDVIFKMRKLLKQFQRVNKNFKYIYIIEKHKNGAFHFHGLIKGVDIGVDNYQLREYNKSEYDRLPLYILDCFDKGVKLYHIPFFDNSLGYNTFSKIRHYNKCCNYITKYITEDMQRIASNYIYFSSRGLSKGSHFEVAYIPSILFEKAFKYYLNEGDIEPIAYVRDLYLDNLSERELKAWQEVIDFYKM